MSLPPGPLLAHLNNWPRERWLDAQLTASVHSFPPDASGKWRTAAVWICATTERLWLVANDEPVEQIWCVAVGDAEQVSLEESWQRDVLHVGPWRVALRRSSRKDVRALLHTWKREKPIGDPWPLSVPLPPAPAPRSAGSIAVPKSLALGVPSGTDERWLLAVQTDGVLPVTTMDRGSVEVPLHLMISDRRAVLVGVPPKAPAEPLTLPAGPIIRSKRAWVLDGRHLKPRAPVDEIELAEALVETQEPDIRWALSVRHALISADPRRALRQLREANELGCSGRCYAILGQIAQALGHTSLAASAAHQALTVDPLLDVAARIRLWHLEAPAVRRTLLARKVTWHEVRSQVSPMLDALASVPAAPDGLPWPPQTPDETWGTALVLHGRFQEAGVPFSRSQPKARAAIAQATLLTLSGDDQAADAWRHAALLSRRTQGVSEIDALARAIELAERAPDHWMGGAWAREDGADATERWSRALELDPKGYHAFEYGLTAPSMRELAHVATGLDRHIVAARALEHAIDQDPSHEGARLALAIVLEQHLDRASDAADALEHLANDLDAGALHEPTSARWTLWVEVARLRARAGQPDRAIDALREALTGDFLSLDTWIAVLSCEGVHLPKATATWWRHIQRLLAGSAVDDQDHQPCAPAELREPELDALHPGGVGWLAQLSHRLDPADPPTFDELTRGLDSLAEARKYDVADRMIELCERLRLAPPSAYVFRGRGAFGVSAWPSTPQVLLIGSQHLDDQHDRYLHPSELRFAIAAELTHLACGHPVLRFDSTVLGTSHSVYRNVTGFAGTAETVFDIVTLVPGLDQIRKVHTVFKIAKTVFIARGAVDKAVNITGPVLTWLGIDGTNSKKGLTREGLSGAALQFRIQAERVALLLTGDLAAAIRALLKESTSSHQSIDDLHNDGLIALLADEQVPLAPDELIRVVALVEFAATRMPW